MAARHEDRLMNILPVSLPSSYGGLAESHGLLRDEGDAIILEYKTKDALVGALKTKVQIARIPREVIASVTLRRRWLGLGGTMLEIQTTRLEPLADVPGMSMGHVSLSIARQHVVAARKFLDDLRLPSATPAKLVVPISDLE
jgi:hypothetical protein